MELREIFGSKRKQNEAGENYVGKLKKDEMGKEYGTYGAEERCLQNLVRKPEVRRSLRRPRSRLENNIKMDINELSWEFVGWMCLVYERERWRAVENIGLNVGLNIGLNIGLNMGLNIGMNIGLNIGLNMEINIGLNMGLNV